MLEDFLEDGALEPKGLDVGFVDGDGRAGGGGLGGEGEELSLDGGVGAGGVQRFRVEDRGGFAPLGAVGIVEGGAGEGVEGVRGGDDRRGGGGVDCRGGGGGGGGGGGCGRGGRGFLRGG